VLSQDHLQCFTAISFQKQLNVYLPLGASWQCARLQQVFIHFKLQVMQVTMHASVMTLVHAWVAWCVCISALQHPHNTFVRH
jgi:hypothetical protein